MATDSEKIVHHLNGFLEGVALFSTLFLSNGAVAFEAELLAPGTLPERAARQTTEAEFQAVLLQWLRFGIVERPAHAPEASPTSSEKALLGVTSDALGEVMVQIRQLFGGNEFRVYCPLEKMHPVEVLQDEFVFTSANTQLYLRGGWSD
ncbi:MAG TPA: hypothetical protein VF629_00490 [Hymenobacter sp.]|jgi:hypothetical protein|uniref:hypothetical protein n=1 Tax=Hymenobacter sp. TaxID=1898978 RepID=UPI002ED87D12